MSRPHNDRRAKEKRRRAYKSALEKQCAFNKQAAIIAAGYAAKSARMAQVAEQKLAEEKIRREHIEAACEAILKHKMLISVNNDRLARKLGLAVRYTQPEECVPLQAFINHAKAYTTQEPTYEQPSYARVGLFAFGAEKAFSLIDPSRSQDEWLFMIERGVTELARVIANMLFVRTMENLR